MNSKKPIYLVVLFVLLVAVFALIICAACILNQNNTNSDYTDSSGKYTMNSSYSLEISSYSFNNDPIEQKTKYSFVATIKGTKEDMENIDGYQPMINMDYSDLLLENGPYNSQRVGNNRKITGNVIFNTTGMTEVHVNDLLEGIEIYDKDGNKYMLYFNFS